MWIFNSQKQNESISQMRLMKQGSIRLKSQTIKDSSISMRLILSRSVSRQKGNFSKKNLSLTVSHTVLAAIRHSCKKHRSRGLSIFSESSRNSSHKMNISTGSRITSSMDDSSSLSNPLQIGASLVVVFGEHRCRYGKMRTDQSVSSSILAKNSIKKINHSDRLQKLFL